jgi:deazaflavin-dependent oxidoreductase (nitroreductase family)
MAAPRYRVTPFVRISNAIVSLLLRLGFRPGSMILLTVRGRTSGLPRTTPVVLTEEDRQRWLVCPFGNVNWVRNLRAAGEADLSYGRHREHIRVVELAPAEAGPFLKNLLQVRRPPAFITQYFEVTANSSMEEFVAEAPRHPVFRIRAAASDEALVVGLAAE